MSYDTINHKQENVNVQLRKYQGHPEKTITIITCSKSIKTYKITSQFGTDIMFIQNT